MNNPINMIKMMMGKMSPEEFVMKAMSNNNNPMLSSLVEMANKGDTESLEKFARNVCNQKGIDFDTDFAKFMENFK